MRSTETTPSPSHSKQKPVVLYDGVCNLCDFTVRFILPRDRQGTFHFAPLQGTFARGLNLPVQKLAQSTAGPAGPESIILLQNGQVFRFSGAVLRIVGNLGFPWNLLAVFWIIPAPIRDAVYRWVARNRYRWFGKQEVCILPRPEWKSRFLD